VDDVGVSVPDSDSLADEVLEIEDQTWVVADMVYSATCPWEPVNGMGCVDKVSDRLNEVGCMVVHQVQVLVH